VATRRARDAAILCYLTPGIRVHKHTAVRGWLSIKQPERSCRCWQLMVLQLDLRGLLRLGMHLGFRYPCRIQVAPK